MGRFSYAVQASLAQNQEMQVRVRQAMLTHAAYVARLPMKKEDKMDERTRSFAVEALRSPDYIAQSMTMGVLSQLEDTGQAITDEEILGAVTNLWEAFAGSAK